MKYGPEIIKKIKYHLKRGSTITSTCHAIGIAKSTFYEWMDKKPDFSDAIKKAMAIPDKAVENSLFKMCTGFRYSEKHFKVIRNKKGKIKERRLVKEIQKQSIPNVTAQIFWTKNRNPEDWKDKHDLELSGGVIIKVISAVPRPKNKRGKKCR